MANQANEATLGTLHAKVAKVMLNALDQTEAAQEAYVPAEDTLPPVVNPALLSVIVKFLDANSITCAPEDSGAMSELEQKLEAKRKRRRVGNVIHLDDSE